MALRRWLPFVLAVVLLAAAASRLYLIPQRISFDVNEGWNGFHAARLMAGAPLYPPAGSMIGNNYPPLSFYLIGALGRLTGDPIIAGRLASLFAVLVVALEIGIILRRFGAPTLSRWLGPFLFLALNATALRSYLALDDPQWLAHAFIMGGVAIVLPRSGSEDPKVAGLLYAGGLMLLGGLIKHQLIAWPLAVTTWLACHRRGRFPLWLASGVALVIAAAIGCTALFGPDFWSNLTGPREMTLARMLRHAPVPLLIIVPMLAWSRPLLRSRATDQRIDLVLLAIAISVPLGLVERGGSGVDFNAHFEAAIALSIGCALAAPLRDRRFDLLAGALLAALFAWGLTIERREVSGLQTRQRAWSAMGARIAATPGLVACEQPALCLWAGKPSTLDFFLYDQRMQVSGASPELDRDIANHRIAAFQTEPRKPGDPAGPLARKIEAWSVPILVTKDGRTLRVPRAVEGFASHPYSASAPDARRRG